MATWPTDDLTNTHTDQSNDDPGQARAELNALILKAKDIIAGAEAAAVSNSVVLRNGDGDVAAADCNCSGAVNAHSAILTGTLAVSGSITTAGGYRVMHGDASQKIWVYRNSAMTGWVIDSSVSDVVLAAKGGSTYTTAGATAGSWTVALNLANHTLTTSQMPSHGHSVGVTYQQWGGDDDQTPYSGGLRAIIESAYPPTTSSAYINVSQSNAGGGLPHGHTLTQASTWRIAAAVNTLQYLDI